MQNVAKRDELVRRARAAADLAAHAIDPADQFGVELHITAEVIVDARAALDHAGQDVVDIVDRKRIVHAVARDCAFGAGAHAVPGFALAVALTAKQNLLAVFAPRNQREHGFGLAETGEIVKIAVLPVRIMRVVVAHALDRRRYDADGIIADDAHQLPAAVSVFPGFDHAVWSVQCGAGIRWRVHLGVQQQCANAKKFDHVGQGGFVVVVAGIFKMRGGDRAEIRENFARIAGQRGGRILTGETKAAEKPAAPLHQCFSACGDGRVRVRQQRFEGDGRISQPRRAIGIQAFKQGRGQGAGVIAIAIAVTKFKSLEPVACIGATATAKVAGQRAVQIARTNTGASAGKCAVQFAVADCRGRHVAP